MDSAKLSRLVRNIRDLKYPASLLRDVDDFQQRLARDLAADPQEAMALLGYLLARDYVRIQSDMGLIVNPQNPEIRSLVDSGALGGEGPS